MTLIELHALLDRLGVVLTAQGDRLHYKAPAGVMTEELKAALAAHRLALLALLARVDDRTDATGPPAVEPTGPAGPDGWGPPPADRGWRKAVEVWPVEWRERWGRRANELQDRGDAWDAAEWIAFNELAPDLADAECRGQVTYTDHGPGLDDSEAVAGIAMAFGDSDPAPAGPSGTGPRDVRRGDRWLPFHPGACPEKK